MSHEVLLKVLKSEAQSILDCAHRIESIPEVQSAFESSIQSLKKSRDAGGRVLVLGVGKSGKIAQKIAATFSSTGTPSIFIHPTEALHGDLGVVSSVDVVLALSAGGNTEEILSLIPFFKSKKIDVIAVTANLHSKLADQATWVLDASIKEESCPHRLAPTNSSTLQLAIGDALAMELMIRNQFTAEDFAQNHPGGSLGRRLKTTVQSVMTPIEKLKVISPETDLLSVANELTQQKLGALLIFEKEKFQGMITDGDLRRALLKKEVFFTLKAKDIMTTNPVTITASQLVSEALDTMQDRPSQINVLPVTNTQGQPVGIVRLHDLAQAL